ncbi:MAG: hypothetical protein ACYCPQ_01810 [Elusimicrobiota bacterium]
MNEISRQKSRADKDVLILILFAAAVFLRFFPIWIRSLTLFWGDLTYLHYPWRAFDAETLQAGRLPLWNPYVYFGMPGAATMQDSLFYPGTLPFFFFGFATALAAYHFFHYWLCAILAYLWLRSLRLSSGACAAGGVSLSWGGIMLSRLPFLNHLAVLALAPALLLFFRGPILLALVLSLSFFAGYPAFLIGSAAMAWVLAVLLSRRGAAASNIHGGISSWARGSFLALAISGCLLIPAWELFRLSPRAHGLNAADIFRFQFFPSDLRQWISPVFVSWQKFNPATEWWKCCYLGFIGWALILIGLLSIGRRKAVGLCLVIATVVILTLGNSIAISTIIWKSAGILKFIRYPGNLSYLAALPLAALAAAGAQKFKRRSLILAIFLAELSIYGFNAFPLAPKALFTSAGPLTRFLQKSPDQSRYLLSPKTLEADRGFSYEDWKYRLYGLTNAPYHLAGGGNFGDPLAPTRNYSFLNLLYGQPSAAAAAALLPWGGISKFLTGKYPIRTPRLRPKADILWHIYAAEPAASLAYIFSAGAGELIPKDARAEPMIGARPARWDMPREDFFEVFGKTAAPSWIFASWPRYPGWDARILTPLGARPVQTMPAMGAFMKIPVPAGRWLFQIRYNPESFTFGLAASVLSLFLLSLWFWSLLENLAHEK